MNQIQKKLYKLLIEVDEICQKHNIVYYLAAGGALGAIRNGGFLPWDDDLDLYITRDNWEKLKLVMKEEVPDNREFVCTEYTELYCNPIGRYVDKETTLMMKSQLLCGKCCGLLVEFFIMDPMPTDEEGKWRHRTYMKAYTEVLSPYFLLNREVFAHNIDFDYKLYNKYYWLSKLIGTKKVLNMLLDKFARFPEEKCQEFCMRWGQRTVIFPKAMFGDAKKVKFEEREFPLVEYPEKTFRVGYGDDWMYVPEGDNQISHDLSNDLEEPFETYVNLYMSFLNEKKLMKAYKKRKRIAIKGLQKREAYERKYAFLCASLYAENFLRSAMTVEQLKELLVNKNFKRLNQQLAPFYQAQADVRLKANDILIPLPDEYIYIAVMNYILQGYYYKASKIMAYREKVGSELSEDMLEAKRLIEFCRALSIAVYDDKNVTAVEAILSGGPKYSELLDFKKAELWVLYKTASTKNEFEKLIKRAQALLDVYEADGEIQRFAGYGFYQLGNREKAEELYLEAVKNTRNGFVWREARELLGIDAYQIVDFVQDCVGGEDSEEEDEEDE